MQKNSKQKKLNYFLYVIFAVVILIAGYFFYDLYMTKKPEYKLNPEVINKKQEKKEPEFKKQGELEFVSSKNNKEIKKVNIEIADSENKRMQGLMYRSRMEEDNGMLFVFPISEPQEFWMKNTIIPLDIIFVNEEKEIVKIHKMTTPFSTKPLPSEKKAMYVVEVNGGYTDKYRIKEGDKISFQITNY